MPAQSCVARRGSGIDANLDHLLLTPDYGTSDGFLIYGIEYSGFQEYAFIQACNPTTHSVPDGTTKFNLLVFQH